MIIAVDFDDTLFEYVPPKDGSQDYSGRRDSIGSPIWYWIDWCKRRASECDQLILWTCREGIALEYAVEACKSVGLFFEAHEARIKGLCPLVLKASGQHPIMLKARVTGSGFIVCAEP